MSRRYGQSESEMGDVSVNIDSLISQLNKQNAKLERMLQRIGTHADNAEFRDMIANERKSATSHTRQIMAALREEKRNRTPNTATWVSQFEREYKRFANIVDSIDAKQKKQIMAAAQSDEQSSNLARQFVDEENTTGSSNSYRQAQSTLSAGNIEFIEYNIDEIAMRHKQIKQVEHDILEISEMWKDLQVMVDEQQVHIDVIDTNIQQTRDKTEQGMKELQQAEEHQRSARRKACCTIMIVMTIIGVIVIVVLALKGQLSKS